MTDREWIDHWLRQSPEVPRESLETIYDLLTEEDDQ
jgi:hypothetical protein